jgi:hypothetical protein
MMQKSQHVNWRKIAITLIDSGKGEGTAYFCANASSQQQSRNPRPQAPVFE